MSTADGREPDPTRGEEATSGTPGPPTNDPDQVTRGGAAGRRLVVLVAAVALLVVLVVWLIVYLTARETSDESLSARSAPPVASAVQ